jgi:hypothetical protein
MVSTSSFHPLIGQSLRHQEHERSDESTSIRSDDRLTGPTFYAPTNCIHWIPLCAQQDWPVNRYHIRSDTRETLPRRSHIICDSALEQQAGALMLLEDSRVWKSAEC